MKIIAITVTYNRLSWLKKNVDAILNQSYKPDELIIIDNNSSDGTKEYLKELVDMEPTVSVILLPDNVGGSGGFEAGFRAAYDHGMDYVWGMDDDAIPHRDALEKLVEASKLYPASKYCLRGNTHFMDENNNVAAEQIVENDNRQWLTFVGFFVSREIVSEIGYPRKDLFVYYDDLDYSLSVSENGYIIKAVRDSVIEHPYIMPIKKQKFLGRQVSVPEMPKWKMYYWMRNNLLIRKGKPQRKYERNILLELYILLKILALKPGMFSIASKGFWHGIIGKSGHLKGCP